MSQASYRLRLPCRRLVPLVVALAMALSSSACGGGDPATARQAEIQAVLEAHLEHEDAMLDILERDAAEPSTAEVRLEAYLAAHRAAVTELGDKRRVLETDPTALALAMRELEPEMKRMFERRRALSERSPELMARERVRAALGALDPL